MEKGKDVKYSAAAVSGLPLTKSPFSQEENEEDRFHNALKELKELGSQLYNAAEYWENAFSMSDQKM